MTPDFHKWHWELDKYLIKECIKTFDLDENDHDQVDRHYNGTTITMQMKRKPEWLTQKNLICIETSHNDDECDTMWMKIVFKEKRTIGPHRRDFVLINEASTKEEIDECINTVKYLLKTDPVNERNL